MTTVNVSNLTGAALDWAVATCEGLPIRHDPMNFGPAFAEGGFWIWDERGPIGKRDYRLIGRQYSPSTNWSQGGPIIGREGIELLCNVSAAEASRFKDGHPDWFACLKIKKHEHWHGPTPLVAGMRAYVANKLGDEVDVPEELL